MDHMLPGSKNENENENEHENDSSLKRRQKNLIIDKNNRYINIKFTIIMT